MKCNKNIKNELKYPSDMDEQCIELYYLLNSLPDTVTFDSCCGHEKEPYMMFFRCDNIDVLTRLGRAVNKNYSDGNWELLVDSVDAEPYGCFWLRTNKVLSKEDLDNSLDNLLYSIRYWFSDEFDDYFKRKDFSELNEDEKIKERILFSLHKDIMTTKNSGCDTKDLERCIVWVKKQGKQKSIWHSADETPKGDFDKEILVQFADSHASVLEISDWEYLDHQTKWAYLKDLKGE